jgi:hypothetical protein
VLMESFQTTAKIRFHKSIYKSCKLCCGSGSARIGSETFCRIRIRSLRF